MWIALTRSLTPYGPFKTRKAAEAWMDEVGYAGSVQKIKSIKTVR